MNMLKFGYGIFFVDGLLDIPEFHFFWGLKRAPQTRFSSYVVFIFQKSLNIWKDICLVAKPVGAHLMDQSQNKCAICRQRKIMKKFWMFTEPDSISLFCLLMYMYFLFILLPHIVV